MPTVNIYRSADRELSLRPQDGDILNPDDFPDCPTEVHLYLTRAEAKAGLLSMLDVTASDVAKIDFGGDVRFGFVSEMFDGDGEPEISVYDHGTPLLEASEKDLFYVTSDNPAHSSWCIYERLKCSAPTRSMKMVDECRSRHAAITRAIEMFKQDSSKHYAIHSAEFSGDCPSEIDT